MPFKTDNKTATRKVQFTDAERSHEHDTGSTSEWSLARDATPKRSNSCRSLKAEWLSELTGWPWHDKELSQFYSKPTVMSDRHKAWRQTLRRQIAHGPDGAAQDNSKLAMTAPDEAVSRLREISRILAMLYAHPNAPTVQKLRARSSSVRDSEAVRCLIRISPFTELNIDLEAKEQAEPHTILERILPPDLIDRLKEYLAKHSQVTCREKDPDCQNCELARFCSYRRDQLRNAFAEGARLTFVDLFCGAGGMSAGFVNENFRPVAASDFNEAACRTYLLNHPELSPARMVCADVSQDGTLEAITAAVGDGDVDVLMGGPPCQGFSSVGFRAQRALRARRKTSGVWEDDDDRNYLFEFMIELTARLKPRVVVMENVPGMDAPRTDRPSFMATAKSMLEELGFAARIWELDAAAYGVPQHRIRKFLVASRAPVAPPPPEPEYQSKIRGLNIHDDLLPALTVDQAIGDLPALEADDGGAVSAAEFSLTTDNPALRHFIRHPRMPMRSNEKLIFNHRSRYNNERDLELFGTLEQGENGLDAIRKHKRHDLMRYRKDVFHDKYFRLSADAPSRTIVSHLRRDGNGFIHPTQTRSITPREGARLQSFPDSYVFCGSAGDQWQQIGNAVPPVLAKAIAGAIREHIQRFFD
jgi:DNA (cytosine-5)-methyltransferase 1